MIQQFISDYAAPVVVAATIGAAGMFGIDHSERISTLENQRENSVEIRRELVNKIDRISEMVIRIDARLKEQDRYEQRKDDGPRGAAWETHPVLQFPAGQHP